MIKKIVEIKNVGRFRSHTSHNVNCSFCKNTFIFGCNTHGKSTLTSIFSSLSELNSDYIIGRKTFDSKTGQHIVLETDNGNVIFSGTTWNKNIPIKIFDPNYIRKNVFSDNHISKNQQENIINIILGKEGIVLEEKYQQSKEKLENNVTNRREISSLYTRSFGSFISFPDFINLKKDNEIDQKIQSITREIDATTNFQSIKTLFSNLPKTINSFSNFNEECLSKTLDIKIQEIKEHISNNINNPDVGFHFLNEGINLLNEKEQDFKRKCVFCGQDIEDEAEHFIDILKQFFSDNYKKINTAVSNNNSLLKSWSIEKELNSFQNQLQKLGVDLDISKNIEEVTTGKESLIIEIEKKISNLNYIISDKDLVLIKTNLQIIKDILNTASLKYQQPFDNTELSELNNTKKQYETLKSRFEIPWIEFCDKYKNLEDQFRDDLKPKEEECFKAKKDYADTIFSMYQQKINDVLVEVGANYKLINLAAPTNRRGDLKLFSLKFDNTEETVPIDGPETSYNFKNTLSDSDKRVLSFAFFVAELQNDPDLSDKIIILDDPVSSCDKDRVLSITQVLKNIKNEKSECPNQLIVMTHNDDFFRFLNDKFEDKKMLQIKLFNTDHTSKIIPVDVYTDFFEENYFKMIKNIRQFAEEKTDLINFGDMRKILENLIYKKFYPEQTQEEWNGITGRGGLINWYLERSLTPDEVKKIINEKIMPHISHHDQANKLSEDDFGQVDKIIIAKIFLNLIPNI